MTEYPKDWKRVKNPKLKTVYYSSTPEEVFFTGYTGSDSFSIIRVKGSPSKKLLERGQIMMTEDLIGYKTHYSKGDLELYPLEKIALEI